jgi:hypothetical protein
VASLQRFLSRVFADLKARRNLDSYVISAAALVAAVLGLLNDIVPPQFQMTILLAGVALLVLNLSAPEEGGAGRLDDYLNDRANLGPFRERIQAAHKLWIYAPSAANILRTENADAIRKGILAHPDGEFRIIIQDPAASEAVQILIKQLDESLDFQIQSLPDEIQKTIKQLRLMRSWTTTGKFDYRLLEYGPGFSLVAVDPHKPDGVVIVEIHGFHNESTESRMNIEITRQQSERWYTYWVNQFEYMWQRARPNEPN